MKSTTIARFRILGSLLALCLLSCMPRLQAQSICHLVPAQVQAAAEKNLQRDSLILDFAVERLYHADQIRVDSIVLYFYSTDYCIKGGIILLDTMRLDKQVKFISLKSKSPCSNWYRMSQKFGAKTKLAHFSRLILRGPELHPTHIALDGDRAPRLLIYGTDKSSNAPFQWLSLYGDASNSGRSSTFWPLNKAAARPSQPGKLLLASGIAQNAANVLYDQGRLEYMAYTSPTYEVRMQSPYGGEPAKGPIINGKEGFVRLTTPAGVPYLKNENHIDCWDGQSWKVLHQITTGTTNTLQAGPDGRIYVSDANLTAYSHYPGHRKLWTKGFGAGNNKGCSLAATNAVGDLVYVHAWGLDSLYALDAATGARRGAFKAKAPVTSSLIVVGIRGTVAWYTGSDIYFLSRDLRKLAKRIEASAAQPISQPIVGTLEEKSGKDQFLYLQGKTLMEATIEVTGGTCLPVPVWPFEDMPKYPIKAMVGDKSGHVFLIDQGNTFFSTFEYKGWPTGLQVAQLVPGPDGSIYAIDKTTGDGQLYALRFQDFGRTQNYDGETAKPNLACANELKVSEGKSLTSQRTLVALIALQVADNVKVAEGANLTLISGGTISFGKGFKVAPGATLKCQVGYSARPLKY